MTDMTESAKRTLSLFITGTDTGVGKTLVSTGLLHALARHHARVVGMKPVAAGTELINGVHANEDVLALRAAATLAVPPELDNPVLLPDPVSPHIAAARAGVKIDIAHLVACHRALAALADAVVVEGAGGFLVPLSATETGADLAQALGLPPEPCAVDGRCNTRTRLDAGWLGRQPPGRHHAGAGRQHRIFAAKAGGATAGDYSPPARARSSRAGFQASAGMAMTKSWLDEFPARIAELDRSHLRRQRAVVTPDGASNHAMRLMVDGRSMLAFCSNDYLGLSTHPDLVQAACAGAQAYGVGSGGSPLVSGHSAANAALEVELAQFVGLPRALYFYAGFATNVGIVPALVGAGDAIFSDALNHACLIDGARLSRAQIHRYAHADLQALDRELAQSSASRKLVISDAIFSMDGDCANVAGLLALCERHDALLLLDDAHGFGVTGPQGRGSLAEAGLLGAKASRRVLYMATPAAIFLPRPRPHCWPAP
jgi:dethiobiotin synthase